LHAGARERTEYDSDVSLVATIGRARRTWLTSVAYCADDWPRSSFSRFNRFARMATTTEGTRSRIEQSVPRIVRFRHSRVQHRGARRAGCDKRFAQALERGDSPGVPKTLNGFCSWPTHPRRGRTSHGDSPGYSVAELYAPHLSQ